MNEEMSLALISAATFCTVATTAVMSDKQSPTVPTATTSSMLANSFPAPHAGNAVYNPETIASRSLIKEAMSFLLL